MKKALIFIAIVVLLVVAGYLLYWRGSVFFTTKENIAVDPKNATYIIDEEKIALISGVSEKDIPDSNSKKVTRYFGNKVEADLNGDGIKDAAFLLTQNSGGSGTFYYVVAALSSKSGYNGTSAIFLGDRIAPQTTEFRNGEIIVNYADRRIYEPMVAFPSIGVSKYFKVSNGGLIEVTK